MGKARAGVGVVGGEFQSRLRVNRFPKKVLRIAFLPGTRASHWGVLSCDCNTRMTRFECDSKKVALLKPTTLELKYDALTSSSTFISLFSAKTFFHVFFLSSKIFLFKM